MQLRSLRNFWLLLAALLISNVHAADATSSTPLRYTFSWPLDGEGLKPRGGTTKGAPIVIETTPTKEWQASQEPGLSVFERDRRAVLAMTGEYRVTFDFLEVALFATSKRQAPYQSWGTEKVFLDSDKGKHISLLHILEMRIVQADGSVSEPIVTKHWRQEWQYEPTHIVEYRGGERWERRRLSSMESKNAWSQTVSQVDESPRYASVGRWQHSASFSTWLSGDTWRPLPRREWSVRSDYQVLTGTNRHTVSATGWLQEENNVKTVLTAQSVLATQPYLAREYGVARYERLRGNQLSAADSYYQHTRLFWDQVRATWDAEFKKRGTVTLRGPVDKLGLFMPLFEHAERIDRGEQLSAAATTIAIRDALKGYGLEQR